MTVAALLALLNEAAELEPVALGLVLGLIRGLKGKTDSELLAGDATDWATILATAQAAQQPK